MNDASPDRIAAFFDDHERLTAAMGRAVQRTLRLHKLLGHPIVVWRDGQAVWVPPEEIVLEDDDKPSPRNGAHG